MTRATMTTQILSRPANNYATVPPAPYVRRTGTVADLEAELAHQDSVYKTRQFLVEKRLQRAVLVNKMMGAFLAINVIAIACAALAAAV